MFPYPLNPLQRQPSASPAFPRSNYQPTPMGGPPSLPWDQVPQPLMNAAGWAGQAMDFLSGLPQPAPRPSPLQGLLSALGGAATAWQQGASAPAAPAMPEMQTLPEQPPMPQQRGMQQFDVPASYLPRSMVSNPYAGGNYLYGFNQSAPLGAREAAARDRIAANQNPWQPYGDVATRDRWRALASQPQQPTQGEQVRAERAAQGQALYNQDFSGTDPQTILDQLLALVGDDGMLHVSPGSGGLRQQDWYAQLMALHNAKRLGLFNGDLPGISYAG